MRPLTLMLLLAAIATVGRDKKTEARLLSYNPTDPSASAASSQRPAQRNRDTAVVHGTLNVVLANGNGIVAATDSMATQTLSGRSHQTLLPNQKLFKLDDTTVCTIAGFASTSWSPFRGATTDISSIISSFSRRLHNEQLRGNPATPIRFKLIALERMIIMHLQVLAAAASIEQQGGEQTSNYRFQLIMAGYDNDGSSWMGTFSLGASPNTSKSGREFYEVKESSMSIEQIGSAVTFMTAGIDFIASNILRGITFSNDPVIAKYNELKRADGGTKLSTEEMEAVASYLLRKTSLSYREVGGENQIAVLQQNIPVQLKQREFPEPVTQVAGPILIMNSSFSGQALRININTPFMFIGDRFESFDVKIDGNYFVGNDFRNCRLSYAGGEILGLDSTNTVIDSVLIVLGNVNRDSSEMRDLLHRFNWLSVVYKETQPTKSPT
jgi:hypothetical protein